MPRAHLETSRSDLSASLRGIMTAGVSCIAFLTLVTVAALVWITTEMRRDGAALRAAADAAGLADESIVDLLQHGRSDELTRVGLEREALASLARAEDLGEAHAAAVATARAAVEAYFAAAREGGPPAEREAALKAAYSALSALASESVERASRAERRVARLDRLANLLGAAAAFALISAVSGLLWWVRQRALRPVLGLAHAMERFGGGDHGARARVEGPAELRAMAEQFNRMAESLSQRRAAQLSFLAGVAHDLRSPISALKLAAQSPHPAAPLPDEPRIRRTLAIVRRQADRLERMLGDLLESARIEGDQLELQREEVELGELCAHVCALFAETSPIHDVRFPEAPEPIWLRCDPIRIEQVLVNLLSNAIKYSPSGGRVAVEIEREPADVTVTVTDEGIGVQENEARLIFEPFRRSRRVPDGVPGSGLGLSAVKRIVESHGGAIRVEPNPGGGSRFSVRLPRVPGDRSGRAARAPARITRGAAAGRAGDDPSPVDRS